MAMKRVSNGNFTRELGRRIGVSMDEKYVDSTPQARCDMHQHQHPGRPHTDRYRQHCRVDST